MLDKLERLKADPVIFSQHVLGFNPLPYQKKILRDPSKRIVACAGRQTGKSTTIAAKAVHFAVTHPNTNTLIISATMRQSMLMMEKILAYAEGSRLLRQSLAYKARTRLRLKNGAWVIALPCGRWGTGLRGHHAHLLILDEAAFIPEVITNVVLPMVATTDGCVWMLSTPWDRSHPFYQCFTNTREWSVHHMPSSANPLIKPEFLEEQRRLMGEQRFATEYLAVFQDEVNTHFPAALIRSCVEDYELQPCSGYGGYDPGGKESYAAFAVVTHSTDLLKVEYYRMWLGRAYADVNTEIGDYHRQYGLTYTYVDQTGLGGPIVEHLKELGLPVEGLTLTDRRKEELFSNLKILFEQKRIIIPHDLELLNALNCVEYERTRVGGYRFKHSQGTHDDLAYALALACWAAKQEPVSGVAVKL